MKCVKELGIKKIGVFRALQLGDMLCVIPAIRSLKQTLPDAGITLIGLPWAKEFVSRYKNYFSDFISFPGFPGLPEQSHSTPMFIKFLEEITSANFDLIIQMQGNGNIVNPMIELLGANYSAGYHNEHSYCPDKNWYIQYPENLQEVERHLSLIENLGCSHLNSELELPISREEWSAYFQLAERNHLKSGEYAVIHAGARDERKWWSAKNFANIGDYISKNGYQVVLTGTEVEGHMIEQVQAAMNHPAINLTGQTNLGVLAALLKNSKFLFSNDTGVSHVAAAVKAPSIIVFLFSDPKRWAPLNRELHKVILPEDSENIELIKANIDLLLKKDDQSRNLIVEQKLESEKGYENR